MRLFHGTNINFDVIDLEKSNPFKDFGKGFYLTDILSQAQELAKKKSKLFGGDVIVQEYEFDEELLTDKSLNILTFDGPSKEWAEFIYNNRSRTQSFHHKYDIVSGPIANDGVAYLLSRYEEGVYSMDELAQALKFRKLNSQYYFGTQKALRLLKRIK